jgi:hypothetical protein
MDDEMNLRKDRRKDKRIANYLKRKAGWGKYVIDCRYHPCLVVETDFYHGDTWGNGIGVTSLITGAPNSCSLMHCGIEPITKKQAETYVTYVKEHSFNEYLMKYRGFTQEDVNEFDKLAAIWNFEKCELDSAETARTKDDQNNN